MAHIYLWLHVPQFLLPTLHPCLNMLSKESPEIIHEFEVDVALRSTVKCHVVLLHHLPGQSLPQVCSFCVRYPPIVT